MLHSWSNQASPGQTLGRADPARAPSCGCSRRSRTRCPARRSSARGRGRRGRRAASWPGARGRGRGRRPRRARRAAPRCRRRSAPRPASPRARRRTARRSRPASPPAPREKRSAAAWRPAGHVGDREVGEVDLVRGEAGAAGRRAGREAAAEEGELEAEAAAVRGREVAGVVPPLGLVLEVRAVVVGAGRNGRDLGRAGEAARGRGRGRARGAGRGPSTGAARRARGRQERRRPARGAARRAGARQTAHSALSASASGHPPQPQQRVDRGQQGRADAHHERLDEQPRVGLEPHRPAEGAHVDHVDQDEGEEPARGAGPGGRPTAPMSPVSRKPSAHCCRPPRPRVVSVASSRVRSTCRARSALHTPMKATTTARRRSASVTAKVRSKIAERGRAQRAVGRDAERGAGERRPQRPRHLLDRRAGGEVGPAAT